MSCDDFQVPIDDSILEECIELTRGVSYRAKEFDFKPSGSGNGYVAHIRQIHRRETEGS